MTNSKKRLAAAKKGERFFLSTDCRVCGNKKRYVSTGACVDCAARHSKEQAKKIQAIIKAHKESRNKNG